MTCLRAQAAGRQHGGDGRTARADGGGLVTGHDGSAARSRHARLAAQVPLVPAAQAGPGGAGRGQAGPGGAARHSPAADGGTCQPARRGRPRRRGGSRLGRLRAVPLAVDQRLAAQYACGYRVRLVHGDEGRLRGELDAAGQLGRPACAPAGAGRRLRRLVPGAAGDAAPRCRAHAARGRGDGPGHGPPGRRRLHRGPAAGGRRYRHRAARARARGDRGLGAALGQGETHFTRAAQYPWCHSCHGTSVGGGGYLGRPLLAAARLPRLSRSGG